MTAFLVRVYDRGPAVGPDVVGIFGGLTPTLSCARGHPRRPPRGALAAATDECLGGSEMRPACRHTVDFFCAKERPARQLERGVRRRPRVPAAEALLADSLLPWPLQGK
jgi:hypothetical protein